MSIRAIRAKWPGPCPRASSRRATPIIVDGCEGYIIDPSSSGSTGSKIGFVATRAAGRQFDKIGLPPAAVAKARAVLAELGCVSG
jgi:hypothetical protein